jgi:hypothetical protein
VVDDVTTNGDSSDDADRRERRRQRLTALRDKRSDEAATTTVAAPKALRDEFGLGGKAAKGGRRAGAAGGGKAGRGAKAAGGKAGGKLAALTGDGADSEAKRKAIGRVVRILTDTPADGTGMVADTPFSKAGVKRLMDMLNERSAVSGASGARVAGGMLKFLSAKDGEESVHGASLQKLQRAGQMAAKRGGGRGRGGDRGNDRGGRGGGGRRKDI